MANTRKALSVDKSMTTLRMTGSLKRSLESAAERNGRALSQEIENRLEESFRSEALAALDAPSVRTGLFLRKLQAVIALIESWTGKSWADDGATSAVVKRAMDKLVAEGMPDDPEWVAAFKRHTAAPDDQEAEWALMAINARHNKLVDRAVDAVTQRIWRHPGHVNDDGSTTPVADLNRS